MNITTNEEKTIEIETKVKLQEYITSFGDEINGPVSSPAQKISWKQMNTRKN